MRQVRHMRQITIGFSFVKYKIKVRPVKCVKLDKVRQLIQVRQVKKLAKLDK